MNMPNRYHQESELDYQTDDERREQREKFPRSRRASYSRASRPAVHNGIHRRRNKRFSW
jgi:hypothetical protein